MLVKGPLSSTIMLFQLMTYSPKATKPLITCNDKHTIQIDSKVQIMVSHCNFNIWKILQYRSIKNCIYMKCYFRQFYIFESHKMWVVFVQLSRTDYQDKDNGQHTGSVILRFAEPSWGTLTFTLHKFNYIYKNTEINVIYINNNSK